MMIYNVAENREKGENEEDHPELFNPCSLVPCEPY